MTSVHVILRNLGIATRSTLGFRVQAYCSSTDLQLWRRRENDLDNSFAPLHIQFGHPAPALDSGLFGARAIFLFLQFVDKKVGRRMTIEQAQSSCTHTHRQQLDKPAHGSVWGDHNDK